MPILGVDASRAMKKEKTGVEWYSWHLLRAMQKFTPSDWRVRLYVPNELGIRNQESGNWDWRVLKWPGRGWTQGRLSMEMIKSPPDVLFIPSHSIPLVHPPQTITTVHDVVFLKYPELYESEDLKNQLRGFNFAKQFAKKIIVPSKATRDDLIMAGVSEGRVVVIPHGVETNHNPSQPPLTLRGGELGKYILFVGRIEKKKNVMNLIHALRGIDCTTLSDVQAAAQHSVLRPLKLVLAGSKGYGAEDVDLAIKTFKLDDRVIQLGWIDRDQYYSLLKNAALLVFPSFGEGFGLPVLEAMDQGIPVVCSDLPVLREVGGNAAEYVDPRDPKDIARGIETVLNNDMLQSEMIKRGKIRAREYTWEKSAKSTWEIIIGL